MRHNRRRLRSWRTAGILFWTTLVALSPLALAGGVPVSRLGIQPPQASTQPTSTPTDSATACQAPCQAAPTQVDALRARIQSAQGANDTGQMRAILDEVLRQQTAMQQHLAMCMEMSQRPRHGR